MSPTTRLGTSTTPTQDPLKKGFFTKGQWHCNCQPRLPAVQFQVRRESKNKGRFFYTCQKDRTKGAPGHPDKCDFFLWAEDARLREEGALLGRRRGAEPPTPTQRRLRQTTLSASVTPRAAAEKRAGPTPVMPLPELERQVGGGGGGPAAASSHAASSMTVRASGSGRTPSTLREIDVETESDDSSSDDTSEDELAPGPTTTTTTTAPRGGPPQAGDKRKCEEKEDDDDDDDDYGDWSSDEEQQLAAITDSSSRGPGAQGRKRDAFATPAAARTHDVAAGLPTPSFTARPLRRVLFTEPEAPTPRKRQRTTESTDTDMDTDSDLDAVLPTSNSPKAPQPQPPSVAAAAAAAAATTPGGGPGITAVIMGLLRDQKVDGAVRARVRQELERSEARARGLERGRDAARQAAQNLEARAAQQQQRIVALENERHLHAEARDKMRTRLMKLCSED